MIVDLRIYEVKPSRVEEFAETYRRYGWPLQQKYLGRCLGWYIGVEGRANQVVHLWAYESQADREKRRAELWADPEWQAYRRLVGEMGLLVRTDNHIVAPTEFSPMP